MPYTLTVHCTTLAELENATACLKHGFVPGPEATELTEKPTDVPAASPEPAADPAPESERDTLVAEYTELFGKAPHGRMRDETIRAKIDEACQAATGGEPEDHDESPASESEAPRSGQTTPTVDDCRDALTPFYEKHGQDAALQLLADHGATRVSTIPDEHKAAFIEACKRAPGSAE